MKILSFIGILIIAIIIATSELPQLIISGDVESLRQAASDNLPMMMLLTFLVMQLQNLVTAVPLILLVTVNVALFGFWQGYMWSWLASVIAATVVFLLTRYWLQSWLMHKVKSSVRERIERNGFVYVFVCRLIPIMPSSLINMAAGVSTIRLYHFVIATLIGNLLFMSALAAVTLGLMAAGWEAIILCLIAVLALAGWLYWRKHSKAKSTRAEHHTPKQDHEQQSI